MGSSTTQLNITAAYGKKYKSDMLDYNGIIALGKEFPGKKANRFIEWFTYSAERIDGKSKTKLSKCMHPIHPVISYTHKVFGSLRTARTR